MNEMVSLKQLDRILVLFLQGLKGFVLSLQRSEGVRRCQNCLHFNFFHIRSEGMGGTKIKFFTNFKIVYIVLGGRGGGQDNYGLLTQFCGIFSFECFPK